MHMMLPIKISTNEASKSQFREPQTPNGLMGTIFNVSSSELHFEGFWWHLLCRPTWLTGRCSHLAESDTFVQTAGQDRQMWTCLLSCALVPPDAFCSYSLLFLLHKRFVCLPNADWPLVYDLIILSFSFWPALCSEWTDLCPPHSNNCCVCQCKWSLMNSEWFRRRHVAPHPTPQKGSREGGESLSNSE